MLLPVSLGSKPGERNLESGVVAPASGLRLALWSPDGLPALDVETDAVGVGVRDPAPDVARRVVSRGSAWNAPRDAVEPPAPGAHAEVEIRLVGR